MGELTVDVPLLNWNLNYELYYFNGNITTTISEATTFYPAESYHQDYLDKISTLFRWRESNEESWNPREEHFKADFDDVLAKRRNSEDLPERYLLK